MFPSSPLPWRSFPFLLFALFYLAINPHHSHSSEHFSQDGISDHTSPGATSSPSQLCTELSQMSFLPSQKAPMPPRQPDFQGQGRCLRLFVSFPDHQPQQSRSHSSSELRKSFVSRTGLLSPVQSKNSQVLGGPDSDRAEMSHVPFFILILLPAQG